MKVVTGSASRSVPSSAAIGKVRVPFIQRASLHSTGGGVEHLFLVDLGLAGAFAERAEPLPVDARVRLEFVLPGNEIPVQVVCRVAWWHPPGTPLLARELPPGVGLEFVEISPEDKERVRRHVLRCLAGKGLRRFHRPLPLGDEEDGVEP